ncbi:hypothetical protein [Streptomyces sp. NBC_01508]|uniref:hypothetical protein n=1 Tax=Streptomyces sp. NBC_01508 TaxID=2903888 RepID=UPI00386CDC95
MAYAQDKVSGDAERKVTRGEIRKLAKVRMTYKGMNEKLRYQEGATVYARASAVSTRPRRPT